MRILHFGADNTKIIVMFHASCMTWDLLKKSIEKLAETFHIIVPVLPGYDLENNSDYTSVEEIADETEKYLLENGYSTIDGLYGISMGGSIVIKMLANKKVDIKNAVIDAGITPYQLPALLSKIFVIRDYTFMMTLRNSIRIFTHFVSKEKYGSDTFDSLKEVMLHASRRTIWNNFNSCNTYSMPDKVNNIDTRIEYWYGSKEKINRKHDIKYVKKIFTQISVKEMKGFNHAEFVMLEPERFSSEIINFIR